MVFYRLFLRKPSRVFLYFERFWDSEKRAQQARPLESFMYFELFWDSEKRAQQARPLESSLEGVVESTTTKRVSRAAGTVLSKRH